MSFITSIENDAARAAKALVKDSQVILTKVIPALQKAEADSKTIEAVTALVSPAAANIETVGFNVLGVVIKAIQDAGEAATAGGLNITLDATVVADIKSVIPAITASIPPATKVA